MRSKIKYSPKAQKDLDDIWDYIEGTLYNPDAALRIVNGIMDRIDKLADFPESGTSLEFADGLKSGYRFVLFENYIAFYRISANNVVYIDRVLYGARDYKKILFPEDKN